jgi:hypothetical protein
VVSLGIFSVASDNSMCPGSTQRLKMSTWILLGLKTADNLPPSSAYVTESGNVNPQEPSWPHRPHNGTIYLCFTHNDTKMLPDDLASPNTEIHTVYITKANDLLSQKPMDCGNRSCCLHCLPTGSTISNITLSVLSV